MHNKQLTYQLLSFVEREITVFSGDNATRNLEASLLQAKMLRNLNRSVYYLNTSHTSWAYGAQAREILGPDATTMFMQRFQGTTITRGNLARVREDVLNAINFAGASVVIINSWEYASCGSRFREDLMFFLKRLVTEEEITVIVWSQTDTEAEAGTIKRSGIGKLAGLARHIEPIAATLRLVEEGKNPSRPVSETIAGTREPKLFAEYQVIGEDGEPVMTETALVTVPDAEPMPAVNEQQAIVVKQPDFDPFTFDLDRVCAQLNTKHHKELRGQFSIPWQNLGEGEAYEVMAGAFDPFSPHFAPGKWRAALSCMSEYPSEYPPLPECWKEVYKTRTMFRELVRAAGFDYRRLEEINENVRRHFEARQIEDPEERKRQLKALEPKAGDPAFLWDDDMIRRLRGEEFLKQFRKKRKAKQYA